MNGGGQSPYDTKKPRQRRGRGRGGGVRGAKRELSGYSSTGVGDCYGLNQMESDREREESRDWSSPRASDFDKGYFQSYAHVGIHEEMIKDHVRTETYRKAIMSHRSSIAGKVVVDVGSGTGILSIFCAFAGAKRVYAVEASEMAVHAQEIVKANNLSGKVIVLHGRVEDVSINEKVDVIVSEWMGYMLLYESMLGSVITARNRWLKPGGLILPSHATLYMAPVTNSPRYCESIDFWRNVYGIDMSSIMPLARQCAFEEPSVETITGENVLTWPSVIKHVNCHTITIEELVSVTAKYKFSSMMRAPFHGFAFWFDVEFNGIKPYPANDQTQQSHEGSSVSKKRLKSDELVVLSTAPEDAPTHWQQTLVYFYEPIEVQQDQIIEGLVTLSQSKENARFLNIQLEYSSGGHSFVKQSILR
ncbi:putative Protein arginine n-methyltransferase [Zostera marina]|uniref:Protein arginine N-methyltransferase domain-containing protein n=1 Tax=Zostera marina TaxID=29655 RepID=A0A0K9Q1D2_ZOSMR|nr:putative Protein arginine n-methyltransferase [Zostera marina]